MSGPQGTCSRPPGSPGAPLTSGVSGRRASGTWACRAAVEQLPRPLPWLTGPLLSLPSRHSAQELGAISEAMETTEEARKQEGGGGLAPPCKSWGWGGGRLFRSLMSKCLKHCFSSLAAIPQKTGSHFSSGQ